MQIHGAELLCVLAGVILFILLEIACRNTPLSDGYVYRNSYGQGEERVTVVARGLEEGKELEIQFQVEERQYTDEQVQAAMEDLKERLKEMILGRNPDLSHVQEKLNLVSRDEKTGFRIRYSWDERDWIGYDGTVYGEGADPENGYPITIKAEISDGRGMVKGISIPLTIFPPNRSQEEVERKKFTEEIARREEESRLEEGFYLPGEYQGREVTYRQKGGREHAWLLVLGILLAILLHAREGEEAKQQKKKRERLLLLDYSGLVSKLQIFLGAGMTIRTAWERIVLDYQAGREKGGEERPAYEEMLKTYYQIRSGMAEGKAYEEFGRRCMLQPYWKLAGLLEQNRKTGTKNLRYLLQTEMADAFEQRKNLARRQGEEAATKLLIPLFLMLGIVMVIVVVPAFLTFY